MMKQKNSAINTAEETKAGYAYYSKMLSKPFDTVEELVAAEKAYKDQLKAKEDKANQKKTDAAKVENAFKALNAARKEYKEKLTEVTKVYSEGLVALKTKFEESRKMIQDDLVKAEQEYSSALKDFTKKYDQFHLTLKDGDFETTISNQSSGTNKAQQACKSIFDLLFNF